MDELQLTEIGARRVTTDTDPEELVLPEESERRLGWIADWLNQSPRLAGEWGLKRYIDGGFRALFRGPPGTGKTMAALALGRATERDVFRIDASAIAGPYVVETERNLRTFLDRANDEGAILLIDAGSFAFAELLRRLEPFEGLAILATGVGIDPAASSRIDVVVDFPMPDEAARALLWRTILAAVKLPQDEKLDFRALAARHELSGAEILKAVRVAASIAASTERKLDMELLESAAAERTAMLG